MRTLALITILAGLAACTTTGQKPNDRQMVTVTFALTQDGRPVDCTRPLAPLGTSKTVATLRDARFWVQDIALIDSGGAAVPLSLSAGGGQNAVLIDLKNSAGGCAGGATISGSVPDAFYTGISFTIGTPDKLPAANPLAGRSFLKLDLDPAGGVRKPDGTSAPSWSLQLASGANRIPVTLAGFHPAHQAIGLDLATLFAASDISRDHGGAVGCASDPQDRDCGPIFYALGLSFSGSTPASPGASSVFRAIPQNSR